MPKIEARMQLVGEAHLSHAGYRKERLSSMRDKTRYLSTRIWDGLIPFQHIMAPFTNRMGRERPGSPEHSRIRREMESALIKRDEPGKKAAKMVEVLGKMQELNDTIIDFRKLAISIAQKPIKWHNPDLFLLEHNFEGAHEPEVERLKREYAEYTKKVENEFDVHDVDIFHGLEGNHTNLRNIGILLETNRKVKSYHRKHGGTVNASGVFGAAHISARLGPIPTLRALFEFQYLPVFFKNNVIKPLLEFAKGPEKHTLTKRGRDLIKLVESTKGYEELHKRLAYGIRYSVSEPIILLDEKILQHRQTLNAIIKDAEEAVKHVCDKSFGGFLLENAKENLEDVDLTSLAKASKKLDYLARAVKGITQDYSDSMPRQVA